MREGLVVTGALQVVGQLRIDRRWELCPQGVDPGGNTPQPLQVRVDVAPARFIGDEGQTFTQDGGEFVFHRVHNEVKLETRGGFAQASMRTLNL